MHSDTVPEIYQIQSQTSKQQMKMIELEFIVLVLLRRIHFDEVHFLCKILCCKKLSNRLLIYAPIAFTYLSK